jgi:hypothetical protein
MTPLDYLVQSVVSVWPLYLIVTVVLAVVLLALRGQR